MTETSIEESKIFNELDNLNETILSSNLDKKEKNKEIETIVDIEKQDIISKNTQTLNDTKLNDTYNKDNDNKVINQRQSKIYNNDQKVIATLDTQMNLNDYTQTTKTINLNLIESLIKNNIHQDTKNTLLNLVDTEEVFTKIEEMKNNKEINIDLINNDEDLGRFDQIPDIYKLDMIDYFASTLKYQFDENNQDYVYLLKMNNSMKNDTLDPEVCLNFLKKFILQRDLNTYFKDILNQLWHYNILQDFYFNGTEENINEIKRVRKEVMQAGIEERDTVYKLFDLYKDNFQTHLKNTEGSPIADDSINLNTKDDYKQQLIYICAYFEELIIDHQQIIDNQIKTHFTQPDEIEKEINFANCVKLDQNNLENEFESFLDCQTKEEVIPQQFSQWDVPQISQSPLYMELLKKTAIGIHLKNHNFKLQLENSSILKNDIQDMFIEVMDYWLNFDIKKSNDYFELNNETNDHVFPLQTNIEGGLVLEYCNRFKIPIRIKEESCRRYLNKSFNQDFNTRDYIQIKWKPFLLKDQDDIRADLYDKTKSEKTLSGFRVTGFNFENQCKQWCQSEDLKFVKQSMRQQIQNRIVSEYFNLSALKWKDIDILYDYFPLHFLPEYKVLQHRYTGLLDLNLKMFCNLSEDEIDDIKSYQGHYVAIYFNFIDTILDNFKKWAQPMIFVALIWAVTQLLIITETETHYSFYFNAMSQFISVVIVLIYSVFTQTAFKIKQNKLNIQWGLGLTNIENVENERVQFVGVQKENQINGFLETEQIYSQRQQFNLLGSQLILVICVSLIVLLTQQLGILKKFIVTLLSGDSDSFLKQTSSFIIGFLLGTQIKLANNVYSKLANWTTSWENPKLESEFETSKFIKIFIFRFANAQLSLFQMIIINQSQDNCTIHTHSIRKSGDDVEVILQDCWQDASISLLMIFFTLLIWNQVEYACCHQTLDTVKDQSSSILDDQIEMEVRESMGKDQMDLTIENGFVMLFGATNPVVFLLLLFNLQVMMNTDLEHIFTLTRRPTPRIANGIGIFEYFYLLLIVVSIITNGMLLAFNSRIIVSIQSLGNSFKGHTPDMTYNENSQVSFYAMHYIAVIWVLICYQIQNQNQKENQLHNKRNEYLERTLSSQKNNIQNIFLNKIDKKIKMEEKHVKFD